MVAVAFGFNRQKMVNFSGGSNFASAYGESIFAATLGPPDVGCDLLQAKTTNDMASAIANAKTILNPFICFSSLEFIP
jgi:hypothetical protein